MGINNSAGITGTFGVMSYNNSTNEVTFNNSGTKTFVIDHPIDPSKYLVHACLEGPEVGVYYRGKGEIINSISTTITLPDYVQNLASEFTIQLTPIYEGKQINQIYASEVSNNSFQVYGENCKFYWLAQGKRKDIDVEPLKSETTVKGNGPYNWI